MATVIKAGNVASGAQVTSDATGILQFNTGSGAGTAAITVDTSQNMGLGTSSPAYKLDVSKTTAGDVARFTNAAASNKSLFVYSDAQYAAIATGTSASGNGIAFDANNNNILFTTASVNRAAINSSGNMGIGTISPVARLNVSGGTTIASLADWNSKATATFDLANPAVRFGIGYDASDQVLLQAFDTTNVAKSLVLQSYGGPLLVGTTSQFGGAKLCVVANSSIALKGSTSNGSGDIGFFRADTGNKAWSISTNGDNFYIADDNFSNFAYLAQNPTAWQFASDRRIKDNIVDLDYGLDAVMQMQPKRYRFKATNKFDIGFIAQELRDIVPEAVSGVEQEFLDTDTENERAAKTLGVGKETLIPVLVKAIQELKAELDATKAEVAALKGAAQ